MTLVDLPEALLSAIGAYAGPLDGFEYAAKATHEATERACAILARTLYPAWSLPGTAQHYSSWRALLDDDNQRAGMWCLAVSKMFCRRAFNGERRENS